MLVLARSAISPSVQCLRMEFGGIFLVLQVGKDESSLRNVRKSKNNPILCPQKIHIGAVGGWKHLDETSRRSVPPYFCSFLPLIVTQSWGPHGEMQTLDTRAWCQEVAQSQQCHRAVPKAINTLKTGPS